MTTESSHPLRSRSCIGSQLDGLTSQGVNKFGSVSNGRRQMGDEAHIQTLRQNHGDPRFRAPINLSMH